MVILACFSATVKGVKLHDLGGTRAIRGEEVVLQRDTSNAYDVNCGRTSEARLSPRSPGSECGSSGGSSDGQGPYCDRWVSLSVVNWRRAQVE